MPKLRRAASLLTPIALALALGACSTSSLTEFSMADLNPLGKGDPLRSSDYNYFYSRDQKVNSGFVTAADLVGPDGRCAFEPAPTFAPGPAPGPAPVAAEPVAAEPASQPINPRSNQALYFTAGPEVNRGAAAGPGTLPPVVSGGPRGVALQMTECEVVRVAGYTDRVEISANERGQRAVTLTYLSGARPGIYRFVGGRLAAMERVAEPAPQRPQKAARTAKKPPPR